MHIDRIFTKGEQDPCAAQQFRRREGEDGIDYIVPQGWSNAAADILIAEVFCKVPLPAARRSVPEAGVPDFLLPSIPDGDTRDFYERDIRQVLHRIAGCLTHEGWRAGLFDDAAAAAAFYDELRYLLLNQMAAPEIALWRIGFDWAYGIAPTAITPHERIAALPADFAPPALPLSGIAVRRDTVLGDIHRRMDVLARAAALRGDVHPLTVTVPIENVDSPAFIAARRKADLASAALEIGGRMLKTAVHHVMDACNRDTVLGFDPAFNLRLRKALLDGRAAGVPEGVLQMAVSYARQGFESLPLTAPLQDDDTAPSYTAALSVSDDFIETAMTGHGFMMLDAGRTSYHGAAPEILHALSEAIWTSGGPQIFFRDAARNAGVLPESAEIFRSGSGGLVFLEDTEAPSMTLNLSAFSDAKALVDPLRLAQAVKICAAALESSFSLLRLSGKTLEYRPLCLGFANLAPVLMGGAIAYDSAEGRSTAGVITAFVTGAAHLASAEMADSIGAFDGYADLAKSYLASVRQARAALADNPGTPRGLSRRAFQLNTAHCPAQDLVAAARGIWDKAYAIGKEQGFRHAHLTALQAEPEAQALLGAQTKDIAPESSLVRFEGYFSDAHDTAELYGKKMNPAVPRALSKLGYSARQIDDIHGYAVGQGTLFDAPHINHASLAARGFDAAALARLEEALKTAQHIRYVFNSWTLGPGFGELDTLGFSEDEIDAANIYSCGTMTLEGAPHLKPEHLAIFDCIAPTGLDSVRRITPEAQIRMQAAVEPFLSGAAVHTVALGHHAAIEDMQKLILSGWEAGLKGLRLYREASSLLHAVAVPLPGEEAETQTAASFTIKPAYSA